jgi:large subunit ribosomal protein L17e
MKLKRAKAFLQNVLDHKEAVAFRRFNGGIGRTAQAKAYPTCTQARWPQKSVEFIQRLLQNAEANAEAKNLDGNALVVSHLQVNAAPKQRRRTYRAHGRINPYMSNPCHIELILTERTGPVPLPKDVKTNKKSADQRLRNGGTA